MSPAHERTFTLQHAFGFNICVCIAMSEANGLGACTNYYCGNGVVETTPIKTEQCDGVAIDEAYAASQGVNPADTDSWNCNSKLLPRLKAAFFFFFFFLTRVLKRK